VHNAGDERVVAVTHRAESVDRNYDKLAGPSVSVSVADDDPERFDAGFDAVPGDLSIEENASGAGTAIEVGSPVTATDADGDSVAYSLEGARPAGWTRLLAPPAPAGFVIDASSLFRKGRAQNFLDPAHAEQIVRWVRRFRDVEDRARVVSTEDIEGEDWTLNISRYVLPPVAEDVPPLPEALAAFKTALTEARSAEDRLRRVLVEDGWLE